MKKKNQSANGRYISVEKLQKALSNIEINEKKNDLFCSLKKIHHLCSDLHLKQASRLANYSLRAFFMSIAHDIVPTPVWSVNAPTACFRWRSTGKRNFFVPFPYLINILGSSSNLVVISFLFRWFSSSSFLIL